MGYSGRISNLFATITGLFLVIEGIWGFNNETVFWIFTSNDLHAAIHLLLGLAGMVLAWAGYTRGFNLFLGLLLVAVGVLRFIPWIGQIVVNLLNVNPAVAYFNIVLGLIAIAVAIADKGR